MFFVNGDSPLEPLSNASIALGDIDNDQDQDLVLIGNNDQGKFIAQLYFNQTNITSN